MAVGSPCLKMATNTGLICSFPLCFYYKAVRYKKTNYFFYTNYGKNNNSSYGICGIMGDNLNYELIGYCRNRVIIVCLII